jgi:hypothetical protein
VHDLLNYTSTIYDANCLVYYAFRLKEKRDSGEEVTITGPLTERARRITEELIKNKKIISTLKLAWEEAEKVSVASALKQALQEGFIQARLGIKGRASTLLEYKLALALRAQLAQLKKESWFFIEVQFTPKLPKIAALKHAYAQFSLDPEKQKKIPPYKGDPSFVDLALVVYSEEKALPLLTNDKELYNFADELREMKLCQLIKGLPHVRFG